MSHLTPHKKHTKPCSITNTYTFTANFGTLIALSLLRNGTGSTLHQRSGRDIEIPQEIPQTGRKGVSSRFFWTLAGLWFEFDTRT